MLLAIVSTFAETLAFPVVIDESPPVLKLVVLSPELAFKFRVLPTTASFVCPVVDALVVLLFAVLVELAPFAVLEVEDGELVESLAAPQPLEHELDAFPGERTISPVWLSATLKVATATPSTLVLTAVITVPETLESPVVIDESPTFNEALLCPVFDPWVRLLPTFALFAWDVVAELVLFAVALLLEPAPLEEFPTVALPPLHVLHPEVEALVLPVVTSVESLVALPVLIAVSPTFPTELVPCCELLVAVGDDAFGPVGAVGAVGAVGGVGAEGAVGAVGGVG